MLRAFLIVVSMLINHSIFSHEALMLNEHSIDSILEITSKVYVNPERVFCEGEKYFLKIDDSRTAYLPELQLDQTGYFVEVNSRTSNPELNGLMFEYTRHLSQNRCPLCNTPGYIAGICGNENCPGVENKRRYEEDRKKKDEEYKQKKKEDKERKKQEKLNKKK